MSTLTRMQAAAPRLPTEPYPGLRPFLDHEAALLMGRASQVKEIVGRLKATHFVAVVGGSGSGKSSLVRAGVVPNLRGYGIPDAGSYWIPVICTPGTTPHAPPDGGGTPAKQSLAEQTPISRLAWKLSQALERLGTPDQEADRRSEIANVFRRGSGFARLVETYFSELPRVGPDPENARFLFVIDQFEELFHPNNHGNDDAKLMVEAVIDHFFNAHERCFVVITMRSEHLADCAAYLELPDAINESLYLVRRLSEQELRDAIVGPAKYYLRLLQRGDAGGEHTLASDVNFDAWVIERLMQDAGSIAWDADHLPLLQHVLARMWEAACERESVAAGSVPARVCRADLERAVAPGSGRPDGWLQDNDAINTLRSSLENWAEYTYRQHPQQERTQIDDVLRHMGYKDPNNGLYFQQRVDVDDPRLLPGFPQPRAQLRQLLRRGFLDTVNYMFWDDENPDRVTLKVSHEAFIRGWERFRKLIDVEADRFDEFVAVLRKCAQWKVERNPKFLLEGSELARVEDAKLNAVFQSLDERKDWFRVLLQYRDGERLAKIEPDVDEFLAASRARLDAIEREKREAVGREQALKEAERIANEKALEAQRQHQIDLLKHDAQRKHEEAARLRIEAEAERADAIAKRNRFMAWTAIGFGLIFAGIAAFAIFIELPAMHSIDKFADARSKAERRQAGITQTISATERLRNLVDGAALVEEGKSGERIWGIRTNLILDWLNFLPPVASTKGVLAKTSSEPVVAGTLRYLLTTMVWPTVTDPSKLNDKEFVKPRRVDTDCGGIAAGRRGTLFLGMEVDRGIFIPATAKADGEVRLYSASWKNDTCTAGQLSWSVPGYLDPALLFDADITHLAVALNGKTRDQDYVNLFRIMWERDRDTDAIAPNIQLLSLIPDLIVTTTAATGGQESQVTPAAILVRKELADGPVRIVPQVKVVATRRTPGGREVVVAGKPWRIFSDSAEPIGPSNDWSELKTVNNVSGCTRLNDALESQKPTGATRSMLQHGAACFDILRGGAPVRPGMTPKPAEESPQSASDPQPLLVTVYAEPELETTDALKTNLPTPIANLSFRSVGSGPYRWLVGNAAGPHDGWIALDLRDQHNRTSSSPALLATPWSTNALRKLGEEVLEASRVTGIGPPPSRIQPGTSVPRTASR